MKKQIQIFAVCLIALLSACQPHKQTNYTVTGILNDSTYHGKKIYISRYEGNKLIDSTLIEGNKFTFKGKIDTAVFCRIDIDNRDIYANFILEGGDINVNFNKPNQPSGTSQNDAMRSISQEEDSLYAQVKQEQKEILSQFTDRRSKEARAALKEYQHEMVAAMTIRCKELFALHNNDAVGYFLMHTAFFDEIFTSSQMEIASSFGPWLRTQKRAAWLIELLKAQNATAEGKPFKDIKGKDIDGNPTALSDYIGKGNYILLDMWASWCGPCIGEIPNLHKLHNKYKDKGLTVLGVFVSDKEENLKKAITNEGVVWPQIIDSEDKAMEIYGVNGIPHIILFAPDGTILKRDLRGQEIINTVSEILDKQ